MNEHFVFTSHGGLFCQICSALSNVCIRACIKHTKTSLHSRVPTLLPVPWGGDVDWDAQVLIILSIANNLSTLKVAFESVHNFLWLILLTDTQTDSQTDSEYRITSALSWKKSLLVNGVLDRADSVTSRVVCSCWLRQAARTCRRLGTSRQRRWRHAARLRYVIGAVGAALSWQRVDHQLRRHCGQHQLHARWVRRTQCYTSGISHFWR